MTPELHRPHRKTLIPQHADKRLNRLPFGYPFLNSLTVICTLRSDPCTACAALLRLGGLGQLFPDGHLFEPPFMGRFEGSIQLLSTEPVKDWIQVVRAVGLQVGDALEGSDDRPHDVDQPVEWVDE